MKKGNGKIHIGTSGWHYPHWKGNFYPEKMPPRDYLNHYLSVFKTVEINNSFYKLPSVETFTSWRMAVPPDFLFAVKASRYITHMKKLKDPEQSLTKFMHQVGFLEEKLGPILFQLPPNWHPNLPRLQHFLDSLPTGYLYTLEFRNSHWLEGNVLDLLRKHQVALCLDDLGSDSSLLTPTTDFVYVRLHGPDEKYASSYSEEVLRQWAQQAMAWSLQGKDVYIYFDNDLHGYAAYNAQTLQKLVATLITP